MSDLSPALPTLHEIIMTTPCQSQSSSSLFGQLPPEIRAEICKHAMQYSPKTSKDKTEDALTFCDKPPYAPKPRSGVELLWTCRIAYKEFWPMMVTSNEHTFCLQVPILRSFTYKTSYSHVLSQPPSTLAEKQGWLTVPHPSSKFRQSLVWEKSKPLFEVNRMRIFVEISKLKQGALANFLRSLCLLPRELTLTFRCSDWPDFEYFSLEGTWIPPLSQALPPTVQNIIIEMESLQGKESQVRTLVAGMMVKWFFRRQDGRVLYAEASKETQWSAPGMWYGGRWIRDDTLSEPSTFHISTVTFRQESIITESNGYVSPTARRLSEKIYITDSDLRLQQPWLSFQQARDASRRQLFRFMDSVSSNMGRLGDSP